MVKVKVKNYKFVYGLFFVRVDVYPQSSKALVLKIDLLELPIISISIAPFPHTENCLYIF